jgi:hypothetical protein
MGLQAELSNPKIQFTMLMSEHNNVNSKEKNTSTRHPPKISDKVNISNWFKQEWISMDMLTKSKILTRHTDACTAFKTEKSQHQRRKT